MNILVTGKNGQLGSELCNLSLDHKYHNFYFSDVESLDITNSELLNNYFVLNKIDLIVNCAAYTAVDKAEEEKEKANEVNNIAVSNLVRVCLKYDIKLIHISTDYVFDGTKNSPYNEDDITNPIGTYGLSKSLGENKILKSDVAAIIIRTSWLYSSFGNNFVKTIIRLSQEKYSINVVNDQFGSPTYAKDLADACMQIINQSDSWLTKPEIFHFSNEGKCSWYDFAKKILEINQIKLDVVAVNSNNYPSKTKRPTYSILNKEKIKSKFNISISRWDDSLRDCLKTISDKTS
jgi:dTDP-4-dehydrorhamnose reductase